MHLAHLSVELSVSLGKMMAEHNPLYNELTEKKVGCMLFLHVFAQKPSRMFSHPRYDPTIYDPTAIRIWHWPMLEALRLSTRLDCICNKVPSCVNIKTQIGDSRM